MPRYLACLLIGSCLLGSWAGCEDRVLVNAPPEDIWVVYGVLNPHQDTQYVRIAKAFQPETDAVEFARQHDPSMAGLQVHLQGNGRSYVAEAVSGVKKDTFQGDFGPSTTVYRFITAGYENRLKPGQQYQLEVKSPQDTSFYLRAHTSIPAAPRIINPQFTQLPQGEYCLNPVPFEDSILILFQRQPLGEQSAATQFELRISLHLSRQGETRAFRFGPTRLFNENTSCSRAGRDNICYRIPDDQVLRAWQNKLQGADYQYTDQPRCGRVPSDVNQSVQIEITAIDTFLANYILANDPAYLNVNTVRKEYTNIQSKGKALGVLGSIAYDNQAVALTPCATFLLGLNPSAGPGICD